MNHTPNFAPIRLAHIIPSMNIGGRERVVLDILQNIDRGRFQVELVCLGGAGTMYPDFAATGIPISFLNKAPGFKPSLFQALGRLCLGKGYQIVHAHNPGAFLYTFFGARLAKVPVVLNTEHGYGQKLTFRKQVTESICRNFIDATMAVSEDLKRRLQGSRLSRRARIMTMYNGIHVERYLECSTRESRRPEFGAASGNLLVGTVGRLAAVKDQETLVKSFAILQEKLPHARLVVVGGGPLRRRLEILINDLNLGPKAVLTGERHDIPEILAAIDIFVLPSLSEGISITLLEAMAAGKPVIATAVGGNREIIADGRSGLLVSPGDPAAMAAAVARIATTPGLKETLAKNARIRVREAFDIQKMIRTLEELYLRLYFGAAVPARL